MSRKYIALMGIGLLSFTGYLDATIVSTALPAMQTSLHMTVAQLQWVMNAFLVGISAFMASMGRVADIYGRRKVFYIGTFIFGLSSMCAGLATTPLLLIICRCIQGITTAITIPVGVALIHTLFDKDEVSKAMGIFGIITGAGLALGPVIGGALVTVFSWPAVFFVNIPFVIIGFILCYFTVDESRSRTKMSLDYFGIIFLVLTIGPLIFAMVEGTSYGWDSIVIISNFVISFVSLCLLFIVENKVAHPIMDAAVFKNRTFLTTLFFFFVGGGLMSVVLFIDPLYLNLILNKSIWMTGVYLFLIPLSSMLSAPFIGKLNQQYGPRALIIVTSILFIIAAIAHCLFGPTLNYLLVMTGFITFGVAWAISAQAPAVYVGQMISQDHITVAIGTLYSFWNIGAAMLLAFSVTLFHVFTQSNITNSLTKNNINITAIEKAKLNQFAQQPDQMHAIINQLHPHNNDLVTLLTNSFMRGMHAMFWPLIILSVISLLTFTLIKSKKQ